MYLITALAIIDEEVSNYIYGPKPLVYVESADSHPVIFITQSNRLNTAYLYK